MSTTPNPDSKPLPPVKAKMRAWAEEHPEQAAKRRVARERMREQRKAATTLSQLIGTEMIEKAAERLGDLLDAQQPIVVNLPASYEDGKLVPGGQEVQFVSDNRTQLEAIKVVAAYSEGLPVARQMVISGDFKDLDADQRDVLLGSASVQDALSEVDFSSLDALDGVDQEPMTSTSGAEA